MGEHINTEIIKTIVTLDTIELPENPTNGDMIKAMFPDAEYCYSFAGTNVFVSFGNRQENTFDLAWWNAPYKRG